MVIYEWDVKGASCLEPQALDTTPLALQPLGQVGAVESNKDFRKQKPGELIGTKSPSVLRPQ